MTTKVYIDTEIKTLNHSSEHGNVNRLPGLCSSGHFAGPEPEAMSASSQKKPQCSNSYGKFLILHLVHSFCVFFDKSIDMYFVTVKTLTCKIPFDVYDQCSDIIFCVR